LNIELMAGETLECAQVIVGHQFNIQQRPRFRPNVPVSLPAFALDLF
jgi:hypothetical protein